MFLQAETLFYSIWGAERTYWPEVGCWPSIRSGPRACRTGRWHGPFSRTCKRRRAYGRQERGRLRQPAVNWSVTHWQYRKSDISYCRTLNKHDAKVSRGDRVIARRQGLQSICFRTLPASLPWPAKRAHSVCPCFLTSNRLHTEIALSRQGRVHGVPASQPSPPFAMARKVGPLRVPPF